MLDFRAFQPVLGRIFDVESDFAVKFAGFWCPGVKILGKLHNFGINIFFIIYASQDAKKSQFVIPHIYSTGLNLSDRDFYLNEDKNNIIKQYRLFLKKLLKHINSIVDNNENNLNNQVENIINIEKNIAQNLLPRDGIFSSTYIGLIMHIENVYDFV